MIGMHSESLIENITSNLYPEQEYLKINQLSPLPSTNFKEELSIVPQLLVLTIQKEISVPYFSVYVCVRVMERKRSGEQCNKN